MIKITPQLVGSVAALIAVIGAGFVAYRISRVAGNAIREGKESIDAVIDATVKVGKEIVTEDLNPASDKNIVYRAVSAVTSAATGTDTTLGSWIYDKTEGIGNAWRRVFSSTTAPNVQQVIDSNDAFRRAEIIEQNKMATAEAVSEKKMSDARSTFRLRELEQVYDTKFDRFMQSLQR